MQAGQWDWSDTVTRWAHLDGVEIPAHNGYLTEHITLARLTHISKNKRHDTMEILSDFEWCLDAPYKLNADCISLTEPV